MTFASLRELITQGASGILVPGNPRNEVIAVLGAPADRSRSKPEILRYGHVELTFIDDRLALVAYYMGVTEEASVLDEDAPTTLAEMERLLRAEKIEFVRDSQLTYAEQEALRVPTSRAVVLFEDRQLRSVQLPA